MSWRVRHPVIVFIFLHKFLARFQIFSLFPKVNNLYDVFVAVKFSLCYGCLDGIFLGLAIFLD